MMIVLSSGPAGCGELMVAGRHAPAWSWHIRSAGSLVGVVMIAKVAGSSVAAGVGVIAGLALMVPMEAGIPIPIPADLVELAIGARVGAGDLPLWIAVLAFEAVSIAGTTVLFLAARGPGHALVARLGPRLGLTPARLERVGALIERRGRPMLAVGRATPGLRTITVIAAGGSGLPARRALPSLIIGSSVFLQLHLFLGYFLGSAAVHALHAATKPALAVFVVLLAGAIVFWLVRRGRRAGAGGVLEGSCPACLALAFTLDHPRELRQLFEAGDVAAAAAKPGGASAPVP